MLVKSVCLFYSVCMSVDVKEDEKLNTSIFIYSVCTFLEAIFYSRLILFYFVVYLPFLFITTSMPNFVGISMCCV